MAKKSAYCNKEKTNSVYWIILLSKVCLVTLNVMNSTNKSFCKPRKINTINVKLLIVYFYVLVVPFYGLHEKHALYNIVKDRLGNFKTNHSGLFLQPKMTSKS